MEPIFLRGSERTPPSFPEFVREGRNIIVSEGGDTVSNRGFLSLLMSVLRVLEGLP